MRLDREWLTLFGPPLLVVLAVGRIAGTYGHFSQTYDEPAHLACGMEWIERAEYSLERLHPPLARVLVAFGPYLAGLGSPEGDGIWEQGNHLLHQHDRYERNLTLARLGVLPFFILACGLVWTWTKRLYGPRAAFIALLLFSTVPSVLAHAGVATTDMALAATLPLALLVLTRWLESPTPSWSLTLGASVGLSLLSKFSAPPYLVAAGGGIVLAYLISTWRRKAGARPSRRRWSRGLAFAGVACLLVVWVGYRFDTGPLTTVEGRPHGLVGAIVGGEGTLRGVVYRVVEVPVPAPGFVFGLREAWRTLDRGRLAYLLGEVRKDGWWYFFPVAVAVKSPIPLLLLAGLGAFWSWRDRRNGGPWETFVPFVALVAILVVSLPSKINIGLRHVLPVFPFLAILGGMAAARWWEVERRRRHSLALLLSLLIWQIGTSAAAHPEYLTYFNAMAGPHPERVLVDSDFDWGQDLSRLARLLREKGVDRLALDYHGRADLARHDLPPFRRLEPGDKPCGWLAISEARLRLESGHQWLFGFEPVARAGKTIRLYHVPSSVCDSR